MSVWKPKEIIVHKSVADDPAARRLLEACADVPVRHIASGNPKDVIEASEVLGRAGSSMLEKILAGKTVVYVAPTTHVVDTFRMPDERVVCPDFDRLKLASNGCFYQCDWCYLKLTYRAAFPFITVRVQYDKIKEQLYRRLSRTNGPVIFNTGELADSLSMEHLTGAAREFIPWIGHTDNGHLFMLTKCDQVDPILHLRHNGRTFLAWSLNAEPVSRAFEIGAPPFARRLEAARRAQEAGYPIRIRIDPIVPLDGWEEAYAETIRRILTTISPERITLGTLRFEKAFYNMRRTLLRTGPVLPHLMEGMEPMFSGGRFSRNRKQASGKYSFPSDQRVRLFRLALDEIRSHAAGRAATIALCKETEDVWKKVGLSVSRTACVCQIDPELPVARPDLKTREE